MKFSDRDGLVHSLGEAWDALSAQSEVVPRVFLLCGREIVGSVPEATHTSCFSCLSHGGNAEVGLRFST